MARVLLLAMVFTIFSCSRQDHVYVAGSTTVLPIVSRAAEQFAELKGTQVIVNSGGSGIGINQLGSGKIAIGMISRDITDSEINQFPGTDFLIHRIAIDAVIPVVSSEVYAAGIRALTLKEIGQIYLGEFSNWNQLGGPDKEILVVDKEPSRGTRHVFMKAVLGDQQAAAPGADLVLGANNEEQTAITQSDAAIGMLSHAWLNNEVKGLAIISEHGQSIEPDMENIINGSFPIIRDLLLVTNGSPDGNSKAFIDFILSEQGQQVVVESGYVSVHQ